MADTGTNVMIGTASVSTVQALGEVIRTLAYFLDLPPVNESQAGYLAVLLCPFVLWVYHKLGDGYDPSMSVKSTETTGAKP